jgi:DUF1365 family protein
VNARALASFREDDHMRPWRKPGQPLGDAVRDLVAARTGGPRPRGRILLLTHLAYFGYCFNPVSFYYVYDEAAPQQVQTVVAEVSNTPW